jgi:hypothetical protein
MLELQIMSVSEEDASGLFSNAEKMRELACSIFAAVDSTFQIPDIDPENVKEWTTKIASFLSQLRLELSAYKKRAETSTTEQRTEQIQSIPNEHQRIISEPEQEPEQQEVDAESEKQFANIIDQEYDEHLQNEKQSDEEPDEILNLPPAEEKEEKIQYTPKDELEDEKFLDDNPNCSPIEPKEPSFAQDDAEQNENDDYQIAKNDSDINGVPDDYTKTPVSVKRIGFQSPKTVNLFHIALIC